MKTPEDVINRFISEENVKFNQEHDDWMIEAMEEWLKKATIIYTSGLIAPNGAVTGTFNGKLE